MPSSSICNFRDFSSPWFRKWSEEIKNADLHRKIWEWTVLAEVLDERGMLRPGKRGLGFAVGTEPLACLFASRGPTVDATDLGSGDKADSWAETNQHASSREALWHPYLIEREDFDSRVNFFNADMNDLSSLPSDTYDFIWSACAMEHLGSLDRGLQFVLNAMRVLKVGGIAAHTTEINVADLEDTLKEGPDVIFRECDIKRLGGMLRKQFCYLEPMDFDAGSDPEDILYDAQPWGSLGHPHLKIELGGFITTSSVIVCRRVA